jgi:L-ascorbate metabolism protein UlaG (beta-lactamase superfamily)
MKPLLLALLLGLMHCSCSNYPLSDSELRRPVGVGPAPKTGVKVTFLGNCTLHIDDGETSLLVDGFLSRPGPLKTVFGQVGPERDVIHAELHKARIGHVDAVLVGHAHHDHALDATMIADFFGSTVAGSQSFAQIYKGSHEPSAPSRLITIPSGGATHSFGRFKVHFITSDHVARDSLIQRLIEGEIKERLKLPAHFTKLKCGEVFALYITHPDARIAVTTTAGAKRGQLSGRKADVIFLGVGYLSKETRKNQRFYLRETVEATDPKLIVPVHWDNFARKLTLPLKPSVLTGNTKTAMKLVRGSAGPRPIRVLDLRESVWIRGGKVYSP